jgi:hypothetical protein
MKTLFFIVAIFFTGLIYSQTVRIDIYSSDILEMETLKLIDPFRELDNGAYSYLSQHKSVYHIEIDLSSGKTFISHKYDQELVFTILINGNTITLMNSNGLDGIICDFTLGYEKVALFWTNTEFNMVRYGVAKEFAVTYPN